MSEAEIKPKHKPNERQQLCIDTLDGRVLVLAGPGTGKTFTVINRISSMIQKGIKPESILCLTFSDAAASEMKSRLTSELGVLASGVNIYTYHSFCNEIIKMYPDKFGISNDVSLINATIERELMVDTINEAELKYFIADRGGKYFYINTFLKAVAKLKGQRLSKEEYLKNIDTNPGLNPRITVLKAEIEEKQKKGDTRYKTKLDEIAKIEENIQKAWELWKIYEIYSKKMLENKLIDFADMINLVIERFEQDSEFLKEVSNRYKYFMVDEYQDTNDLQNSILFNLLDANEYDNVFVVGDDDQIIYGFQGANSENVDNFLKKYPDTKVICLIENNRSTQPILDLSYRIVTQDSTRLENNPLFQAHNIEKKLKAVNKKVIEKEQKIRRLEFFELIQEYNHISEDIEKLINSPACPVDEKNGEKKFSEIAVISSKKNELKEFEARLKAKNIPVQMNEGHDIFKIRSVICTYFYMKALNNQIYDSDKLFGLLLTEPFCINLNDYNKLKNDFNRKNVEHNDFIKNMKTPSLWIDKEKIDNFVSTYDYLKSYIASNNLLDSVIEIINRTRILNYFYTEEINKLENILGIKKIIDEARDLMRLNKSASLNDFVLRLEYSHSNNIEILTDKSNVVQNAVQLLTYHASKGREFSYVYLPNLVENNWEKFKMPGEYKLITEKVLEDDEAVIKNDSELLKKLFVGITRAKYALILSYADNNDGKPRAVTKYLNAVNDFDFDNQIFEYKEDDFTVELYKSISRETVDHRSAFKQEIKERVKNITLSPTSLNCYLKCPRQFFYSYVLSIDVAEADWDAASYGNIIHKILEDSLRNALNGNGYYSEAESVEIFQKKMSYTLFKNKENIDKYTQRGLRYFKNNYKHFIQYGVSLIDNVEERFDGVNFKDKRLNGKIDRIEKLSDSTYALYDYKTSSYTSVNQLAKGGKREDYYNQLCCYKYAYEKKYPNRKVSKTGIMYIEDNKTVGISLLNSDMEYIENLVVDTYKNLENLNFNVKSDMDETSCNMCAYRDLCRLDVI